MAQFVVSINTVEYTHVEVFPKLEKAAINQEFGALFRQPPEFPEEQILKLFINVYCDACKIINK